MSKKERFLHKKSSFITILLLVVLLTTGFIYGQKDVQIDADGKMIKVSTLRSDPSQILKQAGVILGPKDEYRLSTQTLEKNTTIFVYRAVPVLSLIHIWNPLRRMLSLSAVFQQSTSGLFLFIPRGQ